MGNSLIYVSRLAKTYASKNISVTALHDISFQISRGEFVAVMGPSGSGKTTLLNILGCLDRPSAGEYSLDEMDTSELGAASLAHIRGQKVGFVFQKFNLLGRATALENVELPLLYTTAKTDRKNLARGALKLVGLAQRERHLPNQLSGGEQQRVAIARALVNNPMLILADEPTGSLDTKTGSAVLRTLVSLNEAGHTVVLVTHDPDVARFAKRIIAIRDGCLVSDSSPARRTLPTDRSTRKVAGDRGRANQVGASGLRLWDALTISVRALRANAMRSALTMLGVIIGVASVIAMVAVGLGAQARVADQIQRLGVNSLILKPQSVTRHGVERSSKRSSLTIEDAAAIRNAINGVEAAAPTITGNAQIVHGNRNRISNVSGVIPEYLIARNWELAAGRSFTLDEMDRAAKVALIGTTPRRHLFEEKEPVGSVIRIKNVPFTVIGVLDRKGSSAGGFDHDDVVYVPLSTARARVLGGSDRPNTRAVDFIVVKAASVDLLEGLKSEIRSLLRQRHRLPSEAEDDFTVRTLSSLLESQSATSKTLTILLLAVASVSLIVGGISIMNIMLVAVTERSREIGVRLAVGARPRDIQAQFLTESISLSLIGGCAGIIVGTTAATAIAFFAGWPVLISPLSILIAVAFSTTTGVLFGYYPALNASRLDPIATLQHE